MTVGDLLVGVDGGGTKTQAVVSDLQGNVLRRHLARNSKRTGFGWKRWSTVAGGLLGLIRRIPGELQSTRGRKRSQR
jgi:predicted NBD/HSP70 family sugar kinase